MPATFSRIKTWVSNEVLTAADLNAEINNLLNNTIPASIDDYSVDVSTMQTTADPGGVGTESLATTLAGELTRIRYAIKRIAGGAQWYTAPVIDLGSTISAADLATNAITTVKITDANVTRAKLEAVGQQVSSSSSTFTTTSTTYVDVTNLTVTITTTGRPVVLVLQSTTDADNSGIRAVTGDARLKFLRGATELPMYRYPALVADSYYAGSIMLLDVVAAGTYTYKIQGKITAGTLSVTCMVLSAWEL